jgi:hypothetical protein
MFVFMTGNERLAWVGLQSHSSCGKLSCVFAMRHCFAVQHAASLFFTKLRTPRHPVIAEVSYSRQAHTHHQQSGRQVWSMLLALQVPLLL